MPTLSVALLVTCLSLGVAERSFAQTERSPQPKRICFRGRPAEFCRAFWLTEAGYYRHLAGSRFVEPSTTHSFVQEHLSTHWSWEVGGMVNRGSSSAVGATVLLGMDGRGERVGLKGRYRRWLDRDGGTVDLSAGILRAHVAGTFPDWSPEALGVTADVSVGWGDLIATTARADLLRRRDGQVVNAVYGGVRLGSYPAVIGTATAAIVVATLVALFFSGEDF